MYLEFQTIPNIAILNQDLGKIGRAVIKNRLPLREIFPNEASKH